MLKENNLLYIKKCFMEISFLPCYLCLNSLFEKHPTSAALWEVLCLSVREEGFCQATCDCACEDKILCKRRFDDDIRYLEKNGFIVTSELDSEFILVKIQGIASGCIRACVGQHSSSSMAGKSMT